MEQYLRNIAPWISTALHGFGRFVIGGRVSIILTTLALLLPKCPICLLMYFCFFGSCGLGALRFQPVLLPLLSGLLLLNLILFFRRARQWRCYVPFISSSLGAILVFVGVVLQQQPNVPMLTPCFLNQPNVQCLSFDLPAPSNPAPPVVDKNLALQ